MQADRNKFQAIAVGERTHEKSASCKFGSIDIKCDDVVKLLGIDMDFKLNFDNKISNSLCTINLAIVLHGSVHPDRILSFIF